jgi:hypothetical protein
VLGGDVEDRVARLLFRRTGGNALLLRELVRSGVDSGALVRRHEVWSLTGELPLGSGVRELIRGGLAELDQAELRVAQLLAVGEPVTLDVADALVDRPVLEALEDRRVVLLQDTVDGPVVTLGHPLYGKVLRADIPALRLRRLRLELAGAIGAASAVRPRDAVRAALWRVEAGEPGEAADLLAAESAESAAYLQGIHAQTLIFDGRLDDGLALATELFEDTGNDAAARTIAAMAVVAGSHFRGDLTTAERVARQARPVIEGARDRVPFGFGTVAVANAIGLAYVGQLTEADRLAAAMYDRGLAEDDPWLRPRGASALGVVGADGGQVLAHRGRLAERVRSAVPPL